MRPNRRHILIGLAALPLAATARAQSPELVPDSLEDQSSLLQEMLLRAAAEGRRLVLPPGTYYAQNLQVPGGIVIEGRPGASILAAAGDAPVLRIAGSARVGLEGVTVTRGNGGPVGADRGLVELEASDHVTINNCTFVGGASNGLVVRDAAADITHCDFTGHALAAIFSVDSRGLNVSANSIAKCGNGGVLIWGSQPRHDGSIITGNTIAGIGSTNGGNGQNGNGISIFRSNNVIVSDNQVADCAFAAIRLNSTTGISVNGNICRNSGDVAILSEFAFASTIIADNIIDGAAAGISISNLDNGGRLATCTGNIIRNVRAAVDGSPDARPFGIYVEAETTVADNTIDGVPGVGIIAGYGSVPRNVAITGNVLNAVDTGIAVSVASDPAPGAVLVTDNIINQPTDYAIIGIAADEAVSTDLASDAAKYPHVTVADNRVTPRS